MLKNISLEKSDEKGRCLKLQRRTSDSFQG